MYLIVNPSIESGHCADKPPEEQDKVRPTILTPTVASSLDLIFSQRSTVSWYIFFSISTSVLMSTSLPTQIQSPIGLKRIRIYIFFQFLFLEILYFSTHSNYTKFVMNEGANVFVIFMQESVISDYPESSSGKGFCSRGSSLKVLTKLWQIQSSRPRKTEVGEFSRDVLAL